MSLIFLNRYFHPDHSATSQMLSDLAFALAADGRQVAVITSRQCYDDAEAALPANERIDGVEVTRVWTSRYGRKSLAGRAIDYLSFYITAVCALWRLARCGDVVICKTDPPMLSVVVAPVVWLRGARLVNWLQDIFPEVAQGIGIGRHGLAALQFSILRRLRNRSLRYAAANVALGERMQQRLLQLGVLPAAIRVIPNWADGQHIVPRRHSDNALRQAWVTPSEFVVAYSGNLGRAHDIETILGAMAITEKQSQLAVAGDVAREVACSPRIVWLFIGGGSLMQELQAAVARLGLTNAVFKGYQPQAELSASLSVADVHLISLRPELEGLIVPSKIYGIQAAGRASLFIGDRDGEIARHLARTESGISIAQGDSGGLAAMVWDLAADPKRCRRLGANARCAFEDEFDKPLAIERWAALLDAVAQRQP